MKGRCIMKRGRIPKHERLRVAVAHSSSGFTYVLISDLRRDQDSPTQGSSCHRIIVVHQDFRVVGPERRPDLFISRLRLYRRCSLTIVVDRTHVLIVVRALQVRNQGRGRGRGRATSTSSRNVSGSRESLSLFFLCDRDRYDYDYHVEHAGTRD